jgi:hypothetical protein
MSGSLPLDLMVTRSYYKDAGGNLVLTDFDVWVRSFGVGEGGSGFERAPKPIATKSLKPRPQGNTTLIVAPALITVDINKLLVGVSTKILHRWSEEKRDDEPV